MNTKMKLTEVNEAVSAFEAANFDGDAMRPLMDLILEQTDYFQKMFWKRVDIRREELAMAQIATIARAKPGWH